LQLTFQWVIPPLFQQILNCHVKRLCQLIERFASAILDFRLARGYFADRGKSNYFVLTVMISLLYVQSLLCLTLSNPIGNKIPPIISSIYYPFFMAVSPFYFSTPNPQQHHH